MAYIRIYTTPWCGYCRAARTLLEKRQLDYEEINATDPAIRAQMIQEAQGRRTVPQIFIGGTHVGGYTDLAQLDRDGGLDRLLSEKPSGMSHPQNSRIEEKSR